MVIANIEGLAGFTKGKRRSCEIFNQSARKFWDRRFSLGVHYVKSEDIQSLLGLLGAFWLK